MVGAADTRWSSGQATLEHVGLVLMIALMLGALSTWAVRGFQPPDGPPPVIERVAAPLFGGPATVRAPARASADRAGLAGAGSGEGMALGGPALGVGMRGMARAMERAAGAMTGAA
ncbi:MAG: hypothetical protein FJW92_07795, partial [Actinobacteria bacterium]|nr:hypothetical protein [Actinomycetota bacterium]